MSSHYLADPLHEADDDEQDSDYDPELDPEYIEDEDDDNVNEELEAAESLVTQLDPSLFCMLPPTSSFPQYSPRCSF
jgi:hypothetical protein